tara:strand:+ start:1430 stop:1834 length:405 start_codon:yes stop_codon:yes gene_type:complete
MEKIHNLMLKKIKQTILDELNEEYDIFNNLCSIDYKDYINFMNNNIDTELTSIKFNTSKKKYVSRDILSTHTHQCIARIWNNHKASQCSRQCKENKLCGIHNNMLKKYGKLRFDTIHDPLPMYDNYTNNKLWWF